MTILNQASDGLYPELISIFRLVVTHDALALDELVRVCSVGETARIRSTLTRWQDLGLFTLSDGNVSLAPLLQRKRRESLDALTEKLPSLCRALVLKAENCLPLWRADGQVSEDGTGRSADFVRGISWALAQDIYTFGPISVSAESVEAEEQQQRSRGFIFLNKTRWPALRFWGRYLGFASGDEGSFFADPTVAVREALRHVFDEAKVLPAQAFIDSLALVLPVLDSGRHRLEVERALEPSRWKAPPSGHLSTSLSFALRRLHFDNTLDLFSQDDAGSGVALSGKDYRTLARFTHVRLRGAAQ